MGVVIHILDQRTVRLRVGGITQEIGSLRHMSKATEIDEIGAAKIKDAAAFSHRIAAAMLAQAVELQLASGAGIVKAHLVIGWDEGRGSVSDQEWDYLPTFGYAVKDKSVDAFVLHERRNEMLYKVDAARAADLGLVADGTFVKQGQPTVSECRSVQAYLSNFAAADCVLSDGRHERLLVRVVGDALPSPAWLVGRKPMDAGVYPPAADDRY